MTAIIVDCLDDWIQEINDIVNHAIENSCAIYDIRPRSLDATKRWLHDRLQAGLPVKGLLDEAGKFVGFGSFAVFRPFEAYATTVEHSLYVHYEHRGLGYGRQLLSGLIQVAQEQNRHCMIGGIDSHNLTSIRLHEQMGFVKCADIKQVAKKFDRWLDLYFYQRILNSHAT